MNRCLSARRLLEVRTGEGRTDDHAHLRSCADCAERYDALEGDLARIGAALKSTPPAAIAAGAFWLPMARLRLAGLSATFVAAALIGGWWWRPPSVRVAPQTVAVGAFAEEVSVALFPSALFGSDDQTTAVTDGVDVDDVRLALSGRWPCASATSVNAECDDELSALFNESSD